MPFNQQVLCFPQALWPMVEPYVLDISGKVKKYEEKDPQKKNILKHFKDRY